MREFSKELIRLHRDIDSLFDGQVEIEQVDQDSLTELRVFILPKSGLYVGARIEFAVQIPGDYPESSPSVGCVTKVYHPNIGAFGPNEDEWDSTICLNILDSDWTSDMRLEHVINGLLFLFLDPEGTNFSDALNTSVLPEDGFERRVRASVAGGFVHLWDESLPVLPPNHDDNPEELFNSEYTLFPGCLNDETLRKSWWEEIMAEQKLPYPPASKSPAPAIPKVDVPSNEVSSKPSHSPGFTFTRSQSMQTPPDLLPLHRTRSDPGTAGSPWVLLDHTARVGRRYPRDLPKYCFLRSLSRQPTECEHTNSPQSIGVPRLHKARWSTPIDPCTVARCWSAGGRFMPTLGITATERQGSVFKSMLKPFEQILTVLEGSIAVSLSGAEYPVHTGDEIVIPPHAVYTIRSLTGEARTLYAYRVSGR
eukprot:NODE_1816_length_1395_cov_20.973254_g1643_i0.p1 GENE.NODE_1816_length_1395_cov_20.973254_g1643_i0~~NODE_1816_length_1395_cov_20.973254_g1643_i0.p1  ORF type:complete len:422 (+),score=58.13 NODE_1816_length_1395_cov_20.973254_g1643_i0:107-1372(+)